MLKKPTGLLKDEEVRSHVEFLQEQAQGKLVVLDAAPTATAPLLAEDEVGQYGNDFYWRLNDVLYKFSSDAQTTITV